MASNSSSLSAISATATGDQEISKIRRYLPQIIAVSVKSVLLVVYGLTMGLPTILIPSLSGGIPGETIELDKDGISWIGSLNYLCVPLGCILSGTITKPIGRIKAMQAICMLFFAAFLLFHFANRAWHIFLGLFLTGFTGGLLEAPTLIYTVEVTEPSLRGAMCSSSTLAIALGVMVSFILGTVFPWRTMVLINGAIPLAGVILLFFIPESPYWLIMRQRVDEAGRNLAWLRGWTKVDNVREELQLLTERFQQLEGAKNEPSWQKAFKQYGKATFVRPYLLICLTFIMAYSGTTQINIFAIKLFELLKVPLDSYYATILIGFVECLGSICLMVSVRWLGKRQLCFIAQSGIAIAFIITGVYTYQLGIWNFDAAIVKESIPNHTWLPLISILSIGFFSYLMTFTLPWIIMGELYPNNIRDTASGLSAGSGYIIAFIANKPFLDLVNWITLPGVFCMYSAVALAGLFLMYFLLPETEGKPLSEVSEHYAQGGVRLSNEVGRSSSQPKKDDGEFYAQ